MKDGIYKLDFQAPGDFGNGLVTVRQGAVNGGDLYFLYQGQMAIRGNAFSGKLVVKQWRPGNTSVFGTNGAFGLDIKGNSYGDGLSGDGTLDDGSGRSLHFNAAWLSDII